MAPAPVRPPRKILLIVNPAAGHGRAGKLAAPVAELLRRKGAQVEFCAAMSFDDAAQRARAAAEEFGCITALGGDGTVNAVLAGLFESHAALGIIPAGNGNDIAGGLGLPRDPFAAAHVLATHRSRPVDVLRASFADGSTRLYLGAGGVGLDSEAARLVHQQLDGLPGTPRYIAAALWALRNYRPLEAEFETESSTPATVRAKVLLLAVVNTACYGGGVRIAPLAETGDGQLDVVLVEPLHWPRIVEALPVILRNGDLRYPEVRRFRAYRVRITTTPAAIFHGDGELLGRTPVEVAALPSAVQVIAPPEKVRG